MHRNTTPSFPKGPCTSIVDIWTLKWLLCPYFGAQICTRMVHGPFGLLCKAVSRNRSNLSCRIVEGPGTSLFRKQVPKIVMNMGLGDPMPQ